MTAPPVSSAPAAPMLPDFWLSSGHHLVDRDAEAVVALLEARGREDFEAALTQRVALLKGLREADLVRVLEELNQLAERAKRGNR